MGIPVSEDDLARARKDPVFRHQMLAEQLDQLLDALKRTRRSAESDPESTRQIREGVDLAVQLADRLQLAGGKPPRVA